MLQRLTEDMEYAHLLDRAAKCDDVEEALCYLATLAVSGYSTTSSRTSMLCSCSIVRELLFLICPDLSESYFLILYFKII